MMTKMGRPGEDRAKRGRLRGQIRPDLKREMEELVRTHPLFRSVSQLTELAATYYIRDLKRANYRIDTQTGFPILE